MATRYAIIVVALVLLGVISGCGRDEPPTTSPTPTATPRPSPSLTVPPTPTQTLSPTPTQTLTSTPTPTPTSTPTPTALPVRVSGDLRRLRTTPPVSQPGAPCGVVDLLDFPLDPPDADAAFGGRDFGVFRSRYDGHHTGEDWRYRGRPNVGAPVYSVAHGTVTYAQPLGWGADQGVVIVRHVFPDGHTILSFYGHLDPASVVLNPGACVARGDPVGQIGQPRSPPHLHFEIRSHMPDRPGPGYWSVDPTRAGWEPPSQFIWEYRTATSPGVQWARSASSGSIHSLGMLDEGTFGVIEGLELMGIDVSDGSLRWRRPISDTAIVALVDNQHPILYTSNLYGELRAFRLPELGEDGAGVTAEETLQPLWRMQLDMTGLPILMPLPGGGVVVSLRLRTLAVSATGKLLWRHRGLAWPFDWVLADERLIFATLGQDGSLWTVDETGPMTPAAPINGRLLVVDDRIFVYGEDGVYGLDSDLQSATRLYALPRGYPRLGGIIALPGGGLLVAHRDSADSRLIALNVDGSLRWERSYADLVAGRQDLLAVGEQVYLVSQQESSAGGKVAIYALDSRGPELMQIFDGGSRNPLAQSTSFFAIDDERFLVNVGGSILAALDPRLALDLVSREP